MYFTKVIHNLMYFPKIIHNLVSASINNDYVSKEWSQNVALLICMHTLTINMSSPFTFCMASHRMELFEKYLCLLPFAQGVSFLMVRDYTRCVTVVSYHYGILNVPWEEKLSKHTFWSYITSCWYLHVSNLQVYLSTILHKLSNKSF